MNVLDLQNDSSPEGILPDIAEQQPPAQSQVTSPGSGSVPVPVTPTGCVVYANASAAGPLFDGKSWGSAFQDLQEAVQSASAKAPCEVWAAGGLYLIFQSSLRDSLQLKDGVSVYGGFSGQETERRQRVLGLSPSILSGQTKVYHVVRVNANALLDGFTIEGGRGRCSAPNPCQPEDDFGGGLLMDGGTVTIANCTFQTNDAYLGGAIFQRTGTLTASNTRFVNNFAGDAGGALYSTAGSATLTSCLFFNNFSNGYGDTIYNRAAAYSFQNSTLVDTQSTVGEIYYQEYAAPLRIESSILWANDYRVYPLNLAPQPIDISYSDLSMSLNGMSPGPGNLFADPAFVDSRNGDLRLRSTSPCIDTADGSNAPDRDLAGLPRADFAGASNLGVGTPAYVDMGALEYQP